MEKQLEKEIENIQQYVRKLEEKKDQILAERGKNNNEQMIHYFNNLILCLDRKYQALQVLGIQVYRKSGLPEPKNMLRLYDIQINTIKNESLRARVKVSFLLRLEQIFNTIDIFDLYKQEKEKLQITQSDEAFKEFFRKKYKFYIHDVFSEHLESFNQHILPSALLLDTYYNIQEKNGKLVFKKKPGVSLDSDMQKKLETAQQMFNAEINKDGTFEKWFSNEAGAFSGWDIASYEDFMNLSKNNKKGDINKTRREMMEHINAINFLTEKELEEKIAFESMLIFVYLFLCVVTVGGGMATKIIGKIAPQYKHVFLAFLTIIGSTPDFIDFFNDKRDVTGYFIVNSLLQTDYYGGKKDTSDWIISSIPIVGAWIGDIAQLGGRAVKSVVNFIKSTRLYKKMFNKTDADVINILQKTLDDTIKRFQDIFNNTNLEAISGKAKPNPETTTYINGIETAFKQAGNTYDITINNTKYTLETTNNGYRLIVGSANPVDFNSFEDMMEYIAKNHEDFTRKLLLDLGEDQAKMDDAIKAIKDYGDAKINYGKFEPIYQNPEKEFTRMLFGGTPQPELIFGQYTLKRQRNGFTLNTQSFPDEDALLRHLSQDTQAQNELLAHFVNDPKVYKNLKYIFQSLENARTEKHLEKHLKDIKQKVSQNIFGNRQKYEDTIQNQQSGLNEKYILEQLPNNQAGYKLTITYVPGTLQIPNLPQTNYAFTSFEEMITHIARNNEDFAKQLLKKAGVQDPDGAIQAIKQYEKIKKQQSAPEKALNDTLFPAGVQTPIHFGSFQLEKTGNTFTLHTSTGSKQFQNEQELLHHFLDDAQAQSDLLKHFSGNPTGNDLENIFSFGLQKYVDDKLNLLKQKAQASIFSQTPYQKQINNDLYEMTFTNPTYTLTVNNTPHTFQTFEDMMQAIAKDHPDFAKQFLTDLQEPNPDALIQNIKAFTEMQFQKNNPGKSLADTILPPPQIPPIQMGQTTLTMDPMTNTYYIKHGNFTKQYNTEEEFLDAIIDNKHILDDLLHNISQHPQKEDLARSILFRIEKKGKKEWDNYKTSNQQQIEDVMKKMQQVLGKNDPIKMDDEYITKLFNDYMLHFLKNDKSRNAINNKLAECKFVDANGKEYYLQVENGQFVLFEGGNATKIEDLFTKDPSYLAKVYESIVPKIIESSINDIEKHVDKAIQTLLSRTPSSPRQQSRIQGIKQQLGKIKNLVISAGNTVKNIIRIVWNIGDRAVRAVVVIGIVTTLIWLILVIGNFIIKPVAAGEIQNNGEPPENNNGEIPENEHNMTAQKLEELETLLYIAQQSISSEIEALAA